MRKIGKSYKIKQYLQNWAKFAHLIKICESDQKLQKKSKYTILCNIVQNVRSFAKFKKLCKMCKIVKMCEIAQYLQNFAKYLQNCAIFSRLLDICKIGNYLQICAIFAKLRNISPYQTCPNGLFRSCW